MDYTYTIIDANATASLQLQAHLQDYPDFICASTAANTSDGQNQILKFLPDVVIINLGAQAGEYFQMISELHQYLHNIPLLIAVSKTKDHAYHAIKNGFFDYWLLPNTEFEIRKTILKIRKQVPKETIPTTLCLKTYRDYHYINTNEILYLKADNNATDFFMNDGSKISAFKTLKSFEETLPQNFIRIHQSYILNVKYVSRINYGKSTCTIRNIENQLPFSKSYKNRVDDLKSMLSKNSIDAAN
ncbi:LytR/AlgR family response regulator transcription factor [Croceitalea rosinachiae]|uniref:LytTR family DNA-binding domain-containing protein n=1 Tax=Croceitalea rosinachiae TaxID=3075596 RepID=A0ABU3ABM2_9FLAO|nr:LytTR family DNA-binding domain-containing protein [Croceitalea sp. F388]MDT0607305.1 LytTR family DNA-binding domain-containing protein [Croceitalea sp. F388]